MRRFLRAPILLAATVLSGLFACGLDPGGPYNGGGTGTGGGSLPLPTGSENGTPSDAGSEGGALGNGGRQGTVRGQGLLRCDLFTYDRDVLVPEALCGGRRKPTIALVPMTRSSPS